jgi:hypothetical protein
MKDFKTTLQVIFLICLTVIGAIWIDILTWYYVKVRGKDLENLNKIL